MARVLLAWELGAGSGHCAKLAPIATRLAERGHDVSVAARELVTARNVFGTANLHFFQAPFLKVRPSDALPQTRSLAHILHNTGFGSLASLEALCAGWHSIFESASPDMIICDHAPMALLASRWANMRRVVVGTGFTVPPIASPFPDLRYWSAPETTRDELQEDEEIIRDRINQLLARDRLSQISALSDLYADVDERFLLTFRELDHYPKRRDATYWGLWSMDTGYKPDWPAGKYRIFAYLKPPAANWRLTDLLTFLKNSRFASVVHVAGVEPRRLEEFQTEQLRFASKPVDILHAARHCDMAILHGNAGSVTALLLAGVPQVNLPLFVEQLILSRRVEDLGAGLCANPGQPKQYWAGVLEVLKNGHYRDAARMFSCRYAKFNPQQTMEEIVSRLDSTLAD